MSARIAVAALAIALGACSNPNSVSGSVDGVSFSMSNAILFTTNEQSPDVRTYLVLSTDDNFCAGINNFMPIAFSQVVQIELAIGGPRFLQAPNIAGSYPITVHETAAEGEPIALAGSLDIQHCASETNSAQAQGGSVEITHVEMQPGVDAPSRLVGRFHLTFDSGELDGTFDAAPCAPDIADKFQWLVYICN